MWEEKVYFSLVSTIPDSCLIGESIYPVYRDGIFYGYRLNDGVRDQERWKMMKSGKYVYGYFSTKEAAEKIMKILMMDSQVISGLIKIEIRKSASSDLELYNRKILLDHFYLFSCTDSLNLCEPMTVEETIEFFNE